MFHLPLIVGAGGINAAGRSSSHRAFERLVFDRLTSARQAEVLTSLQALGANNPLEDTLVRRLPTPITPGIHAAGAFPQGFHPEKLYPAKAHPKALSAAIFAASDAIHSSGLDVQHLMNTLEPQRTGVFVSSSVGQHDEHGWGGMYESYLKGESAGAKKWPLGFPEMTADFISAYVLGNLGINYGAVGACATFLYNLHAAVEAIRKGALDFALVGSMDAPLCPASAAAFATMGALANEETFLKTHDDPSLRTLSRPFGENFGMALGESAQVFLLMSPELALETGASILGSVPEVFIHADGPKRSITAPGNGNYFSVLRALNLAQALLGEDLSEKLYVLAHGSATPQNRKTESAIFSQIAQALNLNLKITGLKGLLGHTQGSAAADQLSAALGVSSHGLIPGIQTASTPAPDVETAHLDFLFSTREVRSEEAQACLLNAKGFGGNNASALYLSAEFTTRWLKEAGADLPTHARKNKPVLAAAETYETQAQKGEFSLIYHYAELGEPSAQVTSPQQISIGERVFPLNPSQWERSRLRLKRD